MLYKDFSAELLGLQEVIVTAVEYTNEQLSICAELPRREHICPACGTQTAVIHDYRMQQIKDTGMLAAMRADCQRRLPVWELGCFQKIGEEIWIIN